MIDRRAPGRAVPPDAGVVHTWIVQCPADHAAWLQTLLRRHGHLVRVSTDGGTDLEPCDRVDLVLIGITSDDGSLELCRRLRACDDAALVAVSDEDTEADHLRALAAGCDDHLHTGCSPAEVVARLDAVLRWVRPEAPAPPLLRHGPLSLDRANRETTLDGVTVHLTRKEFDLLALLVERPEIVLTREEILAAIWGKTGSAVNRTLDTHVNSLRRKVGRWVCVTVKGYGMRVGSPDRDQAAMSE